jgi:integrase/recombinase XerD
MKKEGKNRLVAPLLQSYFTDGLIKEKNASPHTIDSYTYTFYLLFEYAKKMLKKGSCEITLAELSATFIRNFLVYLDTDRHIQPQSRNQRLTAIRSFFKYISPQIPEMAAAIGQVLAIQDKRTSKKLIHFLTSQEVKALLSCQNTATWIGRRDRNLILFAIETGFRLSEIIMLRWRDIRIEGNYGYVRYIGKGRKERDAILSREMSRIFKSWERETALMSSEGFIFPNVYGGSMSPDTFQTLLKKYARQAEKHCPSLKGKKVSPHVLRHTKAMNLHNSGVDLSMIANMLGHKSIETTQIYLEADIKRQEETLNLLAPNKTRLRRFKPKDNLDVLLKSLRSYNKKC